MTNVERLWRAAHVAARCCWPDGSRVPWAEADERHAAIDTAMREAYLAGGLDEAHGNKRPKWLPGGKGK